MRIPGNTGGTEVQNCGLFRGGIAVVAPGRSSDCFSSRRRLSSNSTARAQPRDGDRQRVPPRPLLQERQRTRHVPSRRPRRRAQLDPRQAPLGHASAGAPLTPRGPRQPPRFARLHPNRRQRPRTRTSTGSRASHARSKSSQLRSKTLPKTTTNTSISFAASANSVHMEIEAPIRSPVSPALTAGPFTSQKIAAAVRRPRNLALAPTPATRTRPSRSR